MEASRETLPAGIVTFLFTDIEGSTRLAHDLGESWPIVLQDHHAVLRAVFPDFRGVEVSTAGDSFFLAFASASDAVAASVAMQRALAAHDWSPHRPIRVRMGMHTGEATIQEDDYAGLAVHAASRVESAAAGGQVLITAATLEAAVLPGEVDVLDLGMHRLKDLPSETHLFQILAPGLDREFPPVRGIDTMRTNMPVPVSTFVGRTEALATVHRLLDDDRLVTLFGPGGTGKTRLSVQLATERLHRYRHGTWFVELDPARDEAGVAQAVADALGLKEEQGQPILDTVLATVRDWEVLLVVDNCEHVIDAAAAVVERLLRSGPGVRVLTTTREPLSISGERVWPVPPMTIDNEAVDLLVDRMRLLQPGIELSPDDHAVATEICGHLDGLPLAVELAAASTLTLTLPEIASQLSDRFGVLTRGSRTALDRQKTLLGAIEWSYDLLDEPRRAFFPRLGVFAAEFDSESAAGVFDREVPDVAVDVDLLARKSLLMTTPTGRYRMLESIRAYARDRLAERQEAAEAAERHARWFASGVITVDSGRWWARDISVVHDDLVAGLLWAAEHDADLALELLERLQLWWTQRGRWSEGRALTERVLGATDGLESKKRGVVLALAGGMALFQGDTSGARRYFERQAATALAIGDEATAIRAAANLGAVAERAGDWAEAEARWQEVAAGDDRPTALAHLAEIAVRRGEPDRAAEYAAEAISLLPDEEIVLRHGLTVLLGEIARSRGDAAGAREHYTDAVRQARDGGMEQGMIYLAYCLGSLAIQTGDLDEASVHLADAITRGRDADARADLAESLEAAARVAAARGAAPEAAGLLGAVGGLRTALGFPRAPAEVPAYDALVAALRTADPGFEEHWAAGEAGALDDAIDAALRLLAV